LGSGGNSAAFAAVLRALLLSFPDLDQTGEPEDLDIVHDLLEARFPSGIESLVCSFIRSRISLYTKSRTRSTGAGGSEPEDHVELMRVAVNRHELTIFSAAVYKA
jgi:hypothetical protein